MNGATEHTMLLLSGIIVFPEKAFCSFSRKTCGGRVYINVPHKRSLAISNLRAECLVIHCKCPAVP